MEWIILFAISWLLFFSLKGWKGLRKNAWCGLIAVGMQLMIDSASIRKGFYEIKDPMLNLWGSSLFFCLGPVFVIATMLSARHPASRGLSVLNVIIIVALYSAQEYLLLARNVLVYHNWLFSESIFINFIIIMSLSWISVMVLGKGGFGN